MATTVQQVTLTIPMNEFDLLTELAKKFKWSVTLPKSTTQTTKYSASFVKMIQDAEKSPKRQLTSSVKNKYFGEL
ncbi:MAG: hypothetical protein LBU90_03765 [Bacteroidales bacterium]|jgi:hypothetical protein|nr:hypothetical protein [Bacteroidales bacterium]